MSITHLTKIQLEITKEMKELAKLINSMKIEVKTHKH